MKKYLLIIGAMLLFSLITKAKGDIKKTYLTNRIHNDKPVIDGELDDKCWQSATWAGGFVQHDPNEGKNPYLDTKFAVLFDNQFIYVAIKAFDSSTDSIVHRMTVRDDIDGDWVGIQFDSYHDLRTAFTFNVSAAGVKEDFIMSNNGDSEDHNWNPIWWVKTKIAKDGWYAEMKIPLTQLRFSDKEKQVWGMQVGRTIFRKSEFSIWQPVARNASGWVSYIGELHGLNHIKSKKVFDLIPFTAAKAEDYKKEEGNPYADGRDYNFNAGLDGKIGLTNNLTLDFTVNPDFGQVEADPSEVNLSAYESFFEEKRPFFIEGRNILSFPIMFGDGGLASQNLFYSRRVGRRPHGYPDLKDNEYTKVPEFTRILAATKITGKTANGWSLGAMESLGAQANAKISDLNNERSEIVEPMTNYSLVRVQKDNNEGNTIIGGMLTSVNRDLKGTDLMYLNKNAYSGGVDFTQYFKDKKWFLKLNGMFSRIEGDTSAILDAQTSSARYFQRPDADYLSLDSSLTSMSGTAANLQFGKAGGGKWRFMTALSYKSPSFEINDMGFLPQSDEIMEVIWVGYRIYKPFSIFRYLSMNFNQWSGWDFGASNTFNGGNVNLNTQFKNYWNLATGFNVSSTQISNGSLRGGPALKLPGNISSWFWMGTNNQKKIRISVNGNISKNFENTSYYKGVNLGLSYQPLNTLRVSLNPSYSVNKDQLQYVGNYEFSNTNKYVMASIEQKVMSMSLRINFNITPDLSIQYWGQPFIASGKYFDFKDITTPMADNYNNRFHVYTNSEISFDENTNSYLVDENKDLNTDFEISNPDFNYKEFLSNLVLRWEYVPGSTLYIVWSQSRDHYIDNGQFDLVDDTRTLFKNYPHDVFMIKFSYRIGL